MSIFSANWELFFTIFSLVKNIIIFLLERKKEKQILLPPDWPQFSHPLDRKQTFFKGGLV